jgi:glyoxylase-like metal-dependent hydrolase (beta-lactamase superfamily II)
METRVVHLGYRSTNYWLVVAGSTRLLIDLGWPDTLGPMQAVMKRMGVQLEQIQYGVATHYHPDHAGLANELKARGMRLLLLETQGKPVAAGPEAKHNVIPTPDGVIRLRFADSRSWLAGVGIAGTVLPTPGHSDDSVSIVLDDGSAFTGDLTPPGLAPDDRRAAIEASWQRLRDAGARMIYPGHGPAVPMRPPD